MRTRSFGVIGLCLSVAACTVTMGPGGGEGAGAGPDGPATGAPGAPAASDPSAPADPVGDDGEGEGDAGGPGAAEDASAPSADGGADADAASPPKHQIPVPTFGSLHASSKTNDVCEFTVNGMVKGTGTSLDVSLVTGTYTVACKRGDGVVASQSATIVQSQTTNVLFDFPSNGTLVAVALDGLCAFYVNGASKGTTSTLKMSLAPATYLVECKPTNGGATKSRSVTLKSGETAMAMFQL